MSRLNSMIAVACFVGGVRSNSLNVVADDIEKAVTRVHQIVERKGLPSDFIPPGAFDPNETDPLFVAAAWHLVEDDVMKEVHLQLHLPKPFGAPVYFLADPKSKRMMVDFSAHTDVQTVLRRAFGLPLREIEAVEKAAPYVYNVPNIKGQFLTATQGVDYDRLSTELGARLEKSFKLSVDRTGTHATTKDARIVSVWLQPPPQSREWIRSHFAWRPIFEIGVVNGDRTVAGTTTFTGPKRLALTTAVQIGYRRTNTDSYERAYQSESLEESYYMPVGHAEVFGETHVQYIVSRGSDPYGTPFTGPEPPWARFKWIDLVKQIHKDFDSTIRIRARR